VEKEEISVGSHIRIGEVTLLPILRTAVVCLSSRWGITGFGTREVIGMVVISPAGNRAINISGEEVSVEEYAAKVPEVRELLKQHG
jgi:hypothetical protein